jgi:tetratricopeptide (TPR) repeat protein
MNLQAEIILDKLRPLKEKGLPELYNDREYTDLIMSFGLNESEWHILQESFFDYLNTGKSYLKNGDLEDAANTLEKAVVIKPNNLEVLSALCEVYLQLWQQNPEEAIYSDRSLKLVNRCLEISPDHEASHTRLTILRPKVKIADVKIKRVIIIGAVALTIILLAVGMMFFILNRSGGGPGSNFH